MFTNHGNIFTISNQGSTTVQRGCCKRIKVVIYMKRICFICSLDLRWTFVKILVCQIKILTSLYMFTRICLLPCPIISSYVYYITFTAPNNIFMEYRSMRQPHQSAYIYIYTCTCSHSSSRWLSTR